MAQYKLAYSGSEIDTLLGKVEHLLDNIYPVGSIYISVNSTSPATLFGGTWEQIQDTFLLASGSTYTAGGTGGSAAHTHTYAHTHTTPATITGNHTLTTAEIPSHQHTGRLAYGQSGYGVNLGAWSIYVASISSPLAGTNDGSISNINAWNTAPTAATGGGGGHTHDQVATTTDSQSTSTTSSESNLPPYLAVYVWKRTA